MTKKSRYLLILGGFVVFLILAPLIILYVRGISFDFTKHRFVATGILAVRVQPADADILLNGKLKKRGSGDIRFVVPADYQVSVEKTGYQPWSKRLTVDSGQVAWASPPYGNIYLFLKDPPAQTLATNVLDFSSQNNQVAVLTKDSLIFAQLNDRRAQKSYPLAKPVDTIAAADGSGQNFILTGQASQTAEPVILLFNSTSGQFTDLSSLFTALPKFGLAGNGIFALYNGGLYQIDPAGKTKTAIFQSVKAFYLEGDSLYFVQTKGAVNSLLTAEPPYSDSQTLLANLPNFSQGNLTVTFGKQIFLLADGGFYLANASMQKLADNISGWNFNTADSAFALQSSGELDYYDVAGQTLNFVTRSSEPIISPRILPGISSALYIKNNQITAIELDTRDNQNQYTLYSGKVLNKFWVDPSGQKILILDDGELKSLVIR